MHCAHCQPKRSSIDHHRIRRRLRRCLLKRAWRRITQHRVNDAQARFTQLWHGRPGPRLPRPRTTDPLGDPLGALAILPHRGVALPTGDWPFVRSGDGRCPPDIITAPLVGASGIFFRERFYSMAPQLRRYPPDTFELSCKVSESLSILVKAVMGLLHMCEPIFLPSEGSVAEHARMGRQRDRLFLKPSHAKTCLLIGGKGHECALETQPRATSDRHARHVRTQRPVITTTGRAPSHFALCFGKARV